VAAPIAPRGLPAPAALPQPVGVTALVSQKLGGGFAGGGSITPSLSANGRYVAFLSGAADLVAGDTNQSVDIFVRDLTKGTTIRLPLPGGAPVPAGGQVSEPAISANGKVVAFTYLQATAGTVASPVVMAWDRDTGTTEIVSRAGTVPVTGSEPSVSGDGRYVAYTSISGRMVPNDSNEATDVFRYDRQKRSTVLVSVGFQGGTPSGASRQPSISNDGTKIAFTSAGGDTLVGQDTGAGDQVYLRDIAAKTTERISGAPGGGSGGGPANGPSDWPSISADGRYVAFESAAGNLVGALDGGTMQVYRRDRQSGVTELVSVDPNGATSQGGAGQPAISRDGRMVSFIAAATDLTAGVPGVQLAAVTTRTSEVYIRDLVAGETALVSVSLAGGPAGARSLGPVIGGNGRFVAFYSDASTLVAGDQNKAVDVFIRDFPPAPMLNPGVVDFGTRAVGTGVVPGAAVLVNAGWGLLSISGIAIDGPAAADFIVQADGCTNAVLHRSEACTITVGFSPAAAGARTATLRVSDSYAGSPRTARLSGRGSLATLTVDPSVARPGLVVTATGSGFPPGAQVSLGWSLGITEDLPVITADANGTFSRQVLVFHNDRTGPRDLVATSVGGTPFPAVAAPILVADSPMRPPGFAVLRLLMNLPLVLMMRG
jgi:Tol biopolymer transport system component